MEQLNLLAHEQGLDKEIQNIEMHYGTIHEIEGKNLAGLLRLEREKRYDVHDDDEDIHKGERGRCESQSNLGEVVSMTGTIFN